MFLIPLISGRENSRFSDLNSVDQMAAPFTLRKVGVPPNSANLTEARRRVFDFFRAACRSIPTVMDIYNLQDVVAPSQLRFAISAQIRNNAHITDPKVQSD